MSQEIPLHSPSDRAAPATLCYELWKILTTHAHNIPIGKKKLTTSSTTSTFISPACTVEVPKAVPNYSHHCLPADTTRTTASNKHIVRVSIPYQLSKPKYCQRRESDAVHRHGIQRWKIQLEPLCVAILGTSLIFHLPQRPTAMRPSHPRHMWVST